MREAQLAAAEADGIVRAHLGRPAQDALEAAVVLEAWGGAPTAVALRLGGGIVPRQPQPQAPGRPRRTAQTEGRRAVLMEGLALLMAILAIAAWAGPLSAQLGSAVLEDALVVALPLTLALQWGLRTRYLSGRAGLRGLAEDVVPLTLGAAAIAAALLAIPRAGPIAALLVTVWVGGTVLARRGWGLAHGALMVAEVVALAAGASAQASLAVLALVTLVAVAIAVRTMRGAVDEPPGPLPRSLAAAAIGALLGGLLVGDGSLGWGVHGTFPALALVPSVVGSVWGGYHLWQLHEQVPRALLGVPLERAGGGPASRTPATDITLGALARLVGSTVVLSLLVLAIGRWTGGTDSPSLFVAFGCVSLVCLLVSLLESLGYLRWALLSAAAGLVVELAVHRWSGSGIAGIALIAGSIAGTALALVPLVGLLRSPGRVLATALWIR